MDDKLRNKLDSMVKEFKSEETTNKIRNELNSIKLYKDVQTMLNLKSKYHRLRKSNPQQFKILARNKCEFMFINFSNIFNRLIKGDLDLNILYQMIQVLEKIETGQMDQHEGSFVIGDILKKLYIDSALKKDGKKKVLKKPSSVRKKEALLKNLSWKDYKISET
jgi:hypothetical protein